MGQWLMRIPSHSASRSGGRPRAQPGETPGARMRAQSYEHKTVWGHRWANRENWEGSSGSTFVSRQECKLQRPNTSLFLKSDYIFSLSFLSAANLNAQKSEITMPSMTSPTSKSRNLKALAIFDPEHHHKVSEALSNISVTCLNSYSYNSYRFHWNSFGFFPTLILLDISTKWAFNITQCLDTRLPGTPVTSASHSRVCGLLWPPLGYRISQGALLPLLLPKTSPWTPR